MIYIIAILCVVGIASGQILFKLSAISLKSSGNIFDSKGLVILLLAFFIYGITTIAWVWVLQKIELGKAYPLMALAFVLVPIGSVFILNERFSVQYFMGVSLIVAGIVIAVRG